MHMKFQINQTKIESGCQSGRKAVSHDSKSDLPLDNRHLRHGLKDGLYTIAKGELINYFLLSFAKINLPSILANSLGQLDVATVLIADIVEQILMETCILDVVGRHLG